MVTFPKISPNLILGIGGLIAIAVIANQIRGAGRDLFGALPALDEGIRKSITDIQTSISGIKLSDVFAQPSIISDKPIDVIPDVTVQGALTVPELEGATSIVQTETGVFINGEQVRTILPTEEKSLIDMIGDALKGLIPSIPTATAVEIPQEPFIKTAAELAEEEAFKRSISEPIIEPTIQPVIEPVVSLLPDEQVFLGGGPSFIGGTIRENPIDTLSEVISAFPQLTASQAADFLSEFSGILPSELPLIDPDIKNIVASIEGQTVQVETVGISDLEAEAQRAAEFTCREFGLNCELVDGMMA